MKRVIALAKAHARADFTTDPAAARRRTEQDVSIERHSIDALVATYAELRGARGRSGQCSTAAGRNTRPTNTAVSPLAWGQRMRRATAAMQRPTVPEP